MTEFKWNKNRKHIGGAWDDESHEMIPYKEEIDSDKNILNNARGFELRIAVEALCRVVSELVKIEENREK